MSTAQDRGWGNPDSPGYRERNIVKVRAGGVDWYVHRTIAYLVEQFINELVNDHGYVFANTGGWDGAYANRNIFIGGRDTGRKSNHSWGLALDGNATANPVSYDGRVHTNLPKNITQIAAKYGLFWGGNYSASKYRDPMHFEFLGTPAEAVALTAAVRRSKTKSKPKISDLSRDITRRFITVDVGETWADIALRVYGKESWYPVLQRSNPTQPAKRPRTGARIYVPPMFVKKEWKLGYVRKGDTYKDIARRYYGSKRRWRQVKAANAGYPLRTSDRIKVPV
jgi:hypothetical protein